MDVFSITDQTSKNPLGSCSCEIFKLKTKKRKKERKDHQQTSLNPVGERSCQRETHPSVSGSDVPCH